MNFKDHTTILDDLERPFAIQVFHSQRQPLSNTDADGRHPCVAMQPCDHVSLECRYHSRLFVQVGHETIIYTLRSLL